MQAAALALDDDDGIGTCSLQVYDMLPRNTNTKKDSLKQYENTKNRHKSKIDHKNFYSPNVNLTR